MKIEVAVVVVVDVVGHGGGAVGYQDFQLVY